MYSMLWWCHDLLVLVWALNHQLWFLVDGTVCEGTEMKWEEWILKHGELVLGIWHGIDSHTCTHWQIWNCSDIWKNSKHFGLIFVWNWIRPSRFEPLLSTHTGQAFPKISQNFVWTIIRHIWILVKFLSTQVSDIWHEFCRSWVQLWSLDIWIGLDQLRLPVASFWWKKKDLTGF